MTQRFLFNRPFGPGHPMCPLCGVTMLTLHKSLDARFGHFLWHFRVEGAERKSPYVGSTKPEVYQCICGDFTGSPAAVESHLLTLPQGDVRMHRALYELGVKIKEVSDDS